MNRVDMLGGLAGGHHGIDARKANAALALHAEEAMNGGGQECRRREKPRDVHLGLLVANELLMGNAFKSAVLTEKMIPSKQARQ